MAFVARRISRTHAIHLNAAPDQVFPLFTPLGEKAWAAGWEPEIIYPPSGAPEPGCVFLTRHAGEPPTIWTLVTYEPRAYTLSYQRVTPGIRTARIDISCVSGEGGRATGATITYIWTALSEHGNQLLAEITPDHYRAYINGWESAINHYLAHGQTVSHQ
jgi:hypothetical protein